VRYPIKISLCLLTLNEIDGCIHDIPLINKENFYEIYAIDGGSTDGTVAFLKQNGIKVYAQDLPSLNAAYIQANKLAKGEYVVVFFPKGTISPTYLNEFRPLFLSGFQLVIASRQINGSTNEEDSNFFKPRKWSTNMLSIFAAMIWKKNSPRVKDVLHGVKGWRRESFSAMKISEYGVSIDIEMVIRAYKLNISCVEFPVIETTRISGQTHFKFIPTGLKILKYLAKELGRKD
jgi:glycosyltransferase involved in cell wall biosynthesis